MYPVTNVIWHRGAGNSTPLTVLGVDVCMSMKENETEREREKAGQIIMVRLCGHMQSPIQKEELSVNNQRPSRMRRAQSCNFVSFHRHSLLCLYVPHYLCHNNVCV